VKFAGKVDNGPMNNDVIWVAIRITDPYTNLDPDPYRDTGKT